MALSFPSFRRWLWPGGKVKEPALNGPFLNFKSDALKVPAKIIPPSRKTKRGWLGRKDEKKIDGEYELVFPSDGACLTIPDSDGPEWSIGWVEPHGPGFECGDEGDGGLLVLVPSYSPGCQIVERSSNQLLSAFKNNLPYGFSPDGKTHVEQWLLLLRNL